MIIKVRGQMHFCGRRDIFRRCGGIVTYFFLPFADAVQFYKDEHDVAAAYHRTLTAQKSTNGTYLAGSVFQSVYVQTLTECLEHCAQQCPYCGSVNAEVRNGTAGRQLDGRWWKCELNTKTEVGSNITLSTVEGWEFYDVEVTRCR